MDNTGISPVTYYIHTDQVGRPQKMTDGSANLVWDAVYDPFGNVTSLSGSATNLLMFPGQLYDSETGVAQNWNREYDSTLGRYIQSDPIGLDGGLNTYTYARNDPFRFVDPTGLAAASAKCKKEGCLDICSQLALPTDDYGVAFQRCMATCLGENAWPEWKKYFPDARSALGAAAGVAGAWALVETIAAGVGLALAF